MRLIMVRHGRTDSNVGLLLDTGEPGADLDANGLEQAAALVELLSEHAIDAVYASNLVRTQQTALPLARARGLDVEVLPGLREIPAGEDEMGTDASRYIGALVAWGEGHLQERVPGGENALEFFARYDDAIDTIAASGAEVAMVVSHGAALRVWATARVDGFAEALGPAHLDNTGVIVVDGSPAEGWTLVHLSGVRKYPDHEAASQPERPARRG